MLEHGRKEDKQRVLAAIYPAGRFKQVAFSSFQDFRHPRNHTNDPRKHR